MIYDYFRVTGAHDAVLDYAELFSVALHDDSSPGTRYEMGRSSIVYVKRFHPMISQESLCKLRIRESAQLKTVLDLYDMQIH